MSDLSAPKSNYGVRIPKVWGSVRVAGNLIWANKIRERVKKKRSGGKGGPKVETKTYSYYGDFAVLLCEGPILGVRRIWLSSKLVYNVSDDADSKTLSNSNKFKNNYLRIYTGTATQSPDSLIQASVGTDNTPAYRHRAYLLFHDLPLENYGNRLPTVTAEIVTCGSVGSDGKVGTYKANLAGIIHEVCVATGLAQSEIDVGEIDQPVTGFFINNVQAARESLSQLQQAYFFDCVESGGKLKFINSKRPGTTQELEIEHLAAYEYGQSRPQNYSTTRTQDLELPSEVSVTYLDPSFNYGEAVQYSRKPISDNKNANSISLPIVLTPSEAKTIADRLLYLAWTRRRSYKLSLLPRHCLLEPGDTVTVPFSEPPIQISKVNIGANLLLEIEAIGYEDTIYTHISTVESKICETIDNKKGNDTYQLSRKRLKSLVSVSNGSTTYTPGDDYSHDLVAGTVTRNSSGSIADGAKLTICFCVEENSPSPESVTSGGDTTLRVLDIPLIVDSDADNGLYLAADGGDDWHDCTVYFSRNGGESYELAKNLITKSTFGACNTVLTNGATSGMDSTNTLSVTIRSGELESISIDDLNNGENTALVGSEIIRFQTATLTDDFTYTLSNLYRGRRGTEWAIATHVAGESFYLLSDYLERVEGNTSDIGKQLLFKAITEGQSTDDVSPVTVTVVGNSLKPYAPINLAATKDPIGNITITWTRRDRKAGDRTDYANFPMSEVSEKYEIDIYNGSNVVRTKTCTSTTIIYTAEEQTTDFSTLQTSVSCRVYQISGVVGRGNGAIATLTPAVVYQPPTITSLNPTAGAVGTIVTITGSHFTGTTSIKFDGTDAIFTVDSDSQITTTVPTGATSGLVTVTTPGGSAFI